MTACVCVYRYNFIISYSAIQLSITDNYYSYLCTDMHKIQFQSTHTSQNNNHNTG